MIRIEINTTHNKKKISKKATFELAKRVLKTEGCKNATIGIIGINDAKMKKLNGTYLNHHFTTDVLSFNLSEESNRTLEGEVYVNLDQAQRQAKDYGVTFDNELRRLIIHGLLHLVGWRDDTRQRKAQMTRRENYYLEQMR